MKKNVIPSDFRIGDQRVRFLDLHRRFATTPYGKILQNNIRFAPYKPKNVSNKAWEHYLGADVNNFSHLRVSFELTKAFLTHCETPQNGWSNPLADAQLYEEEQRMLLLTAIVHDWGEAVIGDIPFPVKTKHDEEKEMIVLQQLLTDQLALFTAHEASSVWIHTVIDIISDKSSKLGKAFNVVERIGYVKTGLRALEKSMRTTGELSHNFQQLGIRVFIDNIHQLNAYAEIYPFVSSFLTGNRELLTRASFLAQEEGIQSQNLSIIC